MPECTYQYGSFVLPSPRIDIDAKPEFAEDGATQTGVRIRFQVAGTMHASSQADFETLLVNMRCQLNQPRLTFSAQWTPDDGSGTVTYFSYGSSDDVEFGPKPGPLTIGKVSGGLAAIYSWSLECKVKECFSNTCTLSPRTQPILCLTRSYEHQVDDNGFTRRTVSGKLEVTSTAVAANTPADSFRGTILDEIPLPKGYQRTSQQFTQSPDGRVLSYSITDQEVMWTLPPSITSGRASFTVRSAPMEAMQEYRLSGRFAAPATVSKATIATAILNLAVQKILGNNSASLVILPQSIELTEEVYGNAIEFNITCTGTGSAVADTNLCLPSLNTIGGKPYGTTQQAQFVGPYGGDGVTGSSGLVADEPIIYDACAPTLTAGQYQAPQSSTLTYNQNTPNSNSGSTPPPPNNPYGTGSSDGPVGSQSQGDYIAANGGHLASPYSDYHEEISYGIQNNAVAFLPKQAGSAPVIQVTATPSLLVYQAGYASRFVYQNDPKYVPVPPTPVLGANGTVISATVTPASCRPYGMSGWSIYTLRWNYVIRLKTALPTDLTSLGMIFPNDARLNNPGGSLFASGAAFPQLVAS